MAVLQKGSKGNEVKAIQTLLNKVGAKPKLHIDGDFGPATDKAVRAFQKKADLAVDGKVGPNTMAALKIGGALPKMEVVDYQKRRDNFQKVWNVNKQNLSSYVKLTNDAAKLAEIATKEVTNAKDLFIGNAKHWEKVAELSDKIIAKQAEFESSLTKNPEKAKKLAKECEDLDKQVEAIGKSKISPNSKKAQASVVAVRKKLDGTYKLIETELAAIDKRKEDW